MTPESAPLLEGPIYLVEKRKELASDIEEISNLSWAAVSQTLVDSFSQRLTRRLNLSDLRRYSLHAAHLGAWTQAHFPLEEKVNRETLLATLETELVGVAQKLNNEEEQTGLDLYSHVIHSVKDFHPGKSHPKLPAFLQFLDLADQISGVVLRLQDFFV